jgi:hypothetical protein
MYQQLWGYKVEEKLYLGVREQKRLNTTFHDTQSHTQSDTQSAFYEKVPAGGVGSGAVRGNVYWWVD